MSACGADPVLRDYEGINWFDCGGASLDQITITSAQNFDVYKIIIFGPNDDNYVDPCESTVLTDLQAVRYSG